VFHAGGAAHDISFTHYPHGAVALLVVAHALSDDELLACGVKVPVEFRAGGGGGYREVVIVAIRGVGGDVESDIAGVVDVFGLES
jgi:hypothetical protein